MLVMTDGDNTAGKYLPLEASDIARGFGIDVYAIGIGGNIDQEQQEVSCSENRLISFSTLCVGDLGFRFLSSSSTCSVLKSGLENIHAARPPTTHPCIIGRLRS